MYHMHDFRGNRCVVCNYCRQIVKVDDCVTYGGIGTENIGVCRDCAKKKGWIKCDIDQEQTKEQTTEYLSILP